MRRHHERRVVSQEIWQTKVAVTAARIVAKLKSAKFPGGICWAGLSQNIVNKVLTALWKATAAKPPSNP